MKLLFCDFDGTLIRHDSFITFARFARGWSGLLWGMLVAFPWLAAWKLRLIPGGKAKERLFGALYRGRAERWFAAKGEEFAAEIDRDLRPDVIGRVRTMQNEGWTPVIVTASMPQWIRPWAERNGFAAVLGTEPQTDADGALTGRFATPNCIGEEKCRRIREAYPDVDACDTFAIGDSPSDRPMMRMARNHLYV